MNCEDVDKWILWALVLVLVADIIALITEVVEQNCDKKEAKERQEYDKKVQDEISELRREVAIIKEQLNNQEKRITMAIDTEG